MFEVIDMPMDWPAEVNYHEAKAYCTWKGAEFRLPTEAEHHVIRGAQVQDKAIESSTCNLSHDLYDWFHRNKSIVAIT